MIFLITKKIFPKAKLSLEISIKIYLDKISYLSRKSNKKITFFVGVANKAFLKSLGISVIKGLLGN